MSCCTSQVFETTRGGLHLVKKHLSGGVSVGALCDITGDSILELRVLAHFCLESQWEKEVRGWAFVFCEEFIHPTWQVHTLSLESRDGILHNMGPLRIEWSEATMFPFASWHQGVQLFSQLVSNLVCKRWDPKVRVSSVFDIGHYACATIAIIVFSACSFCDLIRQDNRTLFSCFCIVVVVWFVFCFFLT